MRIGSYLCIQPATLIECSRTPAQRKYLALSAFHALVKYTEFAQSYSHASKSCRSSSDPNPMLVGFPDKAVTATSLESLTMISAGG